MKMLSNGYLNLKPEEGVCCAAGNAVGIGCMDGMQVRVNGQMLEWKETDSARLDRMRGVWHRSVMASVEGGSVTFTSDCFVSLTQKELLAVCCRLKADVPVYVEMTPYLRAGSAEEWERRAEEEGEDGPAILLRSKANGLAVAAAMSCWSDGLEMQSRRMEEGYVDGLYCANLQAGEEVTLEKCVLIFTSRDYEEKALTTIALRAASRAREIGCDELLADHTAAWRARWAACDVSVEGDEEVQEEIRSCIFDLISTFAQEEPELRAANCEETARSIPACLAFAGKETARQMLLGYHDRLEEACESAQRQGSMGALYPMPDAQPEALIAYSIFEYATATGDYDIMLAEGLDVLCGVARYYTDRAGFREENETYVIEYPDADGSPRTGGWYLNRLAAWCIGLFITRARRAAQERLDELGVTKEELAYMLDVMQHLEIPETEIAGIPGVDKPEEVLRGLYVLRHLYDSALIARTLEVYAPQVKQPDAVCCAAAAQAGKPELALEWLRQLHPQTVAEQAEYWLAMVHGFAGLQTTDDLVLNPVLPKGWKGYHICFGCRGRVLGLQVEEERISVELLDGAPVEIVLCGTTQRLTSQIMHIF